MAQITLNSTGVASNGTLALQSNGTTTAVTIDASQNVGIGTASPNAKLQVDSSSATYSANIRARNSNFGSGVVGAASGILTVATDMNNIAFYTGSNLGVDGTSVPTNERARIDSSGNLLVGKTSTSDTVVGGLMAANGAVTSVRSESTNAALSYVLYSTGASNYRFYVGMGGTIFATSITITAISDQRLKENVRDIDTGLDAIMALKPRRFDWKEGKGQDKKDVAGFIAQEFEDVFPECVGTSMAGADGIEYKNINHETLIPTLVKAIQEQQALITQLTARITALEGA